MESTPFVTLWLSLAVLGACGGDGPPVAATSAAATGTAANRSTATPSGASATSATSGAPRTAPPNANGSVSASAAPSPKTDDCGEKGQPLCPMQGWMKANVGKAMNAGDKDKVVAGFKVIAANAPAGFDDWKAIAEAGAKAAASGDLAAAKPSCKKCHNAYQDRYRAEQRDKPWP